ncbi:MAG: peptidase M28, partial [Vicinamibacterales bacterium]
MQGTRAARVGALVVALALAGCGGAGAGPQAPAAPPPAAAGSPLDADRLLATVRALTAPEMEGRAAGTTGNMRARAWIVDRFTAIGLALIGEAFLKPFAWVPAGAQSAVDGANVVGR